MPVEVGPLIITSSKQLAPDGSSNSYPVRSALELKTNYPTKSSGYYWVQSEKMPSPLQMYCNLDSDCDGGGWDFYPITGGTSVSYATETHSGLQYGLDLVYPRSQGHWKAMYRFIVNVLGASLSTYLQTCGKIFATEKSAEVPTGPYYGMNGNYTSYIMRNPKYYGTGAPDWKVPDEGRWWLRDSTFSEPNGDQYANGFLGLYAASYSLNSEGVLSGFNDGGAYATGTSYLVSTNLRG